MGASRHDHGIGVLRELQTLEIDGKVQETLRLEYHGGASVLAPISEIDRIWLTHRTDTPEKVVVNWETDRPGESLVEYGVEGEAVTGTAQDSAKPPVP